MFDVVIVSEMRKKASRFISLLKHHTQQILLKRKMCCSSVKSDEHTKYIQVQALTFIIVVVGELKQQEHRKGSRK